MTNQYNIALKYLYFLIASTPLRTSLYIYSLNNISTYIILSSTSKILISIFIFPFINSYGCTNYFIVLYNINYSPTLSFLHIFSQKASDCLSSVDDKKEPPELLPFPSFLYKSNYIAKQAFSIPTPLQQKKRHHAVCLHSFLFLFRNKL